MSNPCNDPIVELVVAKLRSRADIVLEKYGVNLWDSPESLQAFLRHAQSEALDFANYLEVLIQRVGRVDSQPTDDVAQIEDDGFITVHVTEGGCNA